MNLSNVMSATKTALFTVSAVSNNRSTSNNSTLPDPSLRGARMLQSSPSLFQCASGTYTDIKSIATTQETAGFCFTTQLESCTCTRDVQNNSNLNRTGGLANLTCIPENESYDPDIRPIRARFNNETTYATHIEGLVQDGQNKAGCIEDANALTDAVCNAAETCKETYDQNVDSLRELIFSSGEDRVFATAARRINVPDVCVQPVIAEDNLKTCLAAPDATVQPSATPSQTPSSLTSINSEAPSGAPIAPTTEESRPLGDADNTKQINAVKTLLVMAGLFTIAAGTVFAYARNRSSTENNNDTRNTPTAATNPTTTDPTTINQTNTLQTIEEGDEAAESSAKTYHAVVDPEDSLGESPNPVMPDNVDKILENIKRIEADHSSTTRSSASFLNLAIQRGEFSSLNAVTEEMGEP